MLIIRTCRKILTACLLTISCTVSNAQDLQDVQLLTEAYPPYNYSSGGILKGISVDLLIAASHKMETPVRRDTIKLQPWARGYRKAVEGPNIGLFSMTRTEARENKFKWVGPIAKTRIVIIAKKSSAIKISSPDNIKNFEIGVIRDDIGDQMITALGVPEDRIQRGASANSLAKKLNADRIQLWAYEENVARLFIKTNDLDNDDFVVVHVLKEGELYYAFSKDISDQLIEKLQKGLDQVKMSPGKIGKTLYDDILSNYL
ncbi:substrate-binding periplasmic protein [Psychromonas ossibalaenae]|uniref:substrate-binding periplasmic protein n=1 Tax=Psychromonas ossibalaenae TaxID=444922 RepID=UPI0003A4A666|nr:transporter substrate-binding domain-containing protein [Psychromonas ossibalaenae]